MWILAEDDVKNIQEKFDNCDMLSDDAIYLSLTRTHVAAWADKVTHINSSTVRSESTVWGSLDKIIRETAFLLLNELVTTNINSRGIERIALACVHVFLKANGYELDHRYPEKIIEVARLVRHQQGKEQASKILKEKLIVCKPTISCLPEKYPSYEKYATDILKQISKALEERPALYKKLGFRVDWDLEQIPAAIMLVNKKLCREEGNVNPSDPSFIFKCSQLLFGHFYKPKRIAVLMHHMALIDHGETLSLSDQQIEDIQEPGPELNWEFRPDGFEFRIDGRHIVSPECSILQKKIV